MVYGKLTQVCQLGIVYTYPSCYFDGRTRRCPPHGWAAFAFVALRIRARKRDWLTRVGRKRAVRGSMVEVTSRMEVMGRDLRARQKKSLIRRGSKILKWEFGDRNNGNENENDDLD